MSHFDYERSKEFLGERPIPFGEHPDLKAWDVENKSDYAAVADLRCYDLDAISKKMAAGDNAILIRELASPDAWFVLEYEYAFVEFKETDFSRVKMPFYAQEIKLPQNVALFHLKELLFKHLAPKITGAAVHAMLLCDLLHQKDYKHFFVNPDAKVSLYLVINDVKSVASFNAIAVQALKNFGSFGLKIKVVSIDTFITEIAPTLLATSALQPTA